jgi:glycosyltransferase involved in cell wall biosynthesis
MLPLSVVILAKNEAHNIERCVKPLLRLSDDILVLDNGSTDGTQAIVKALGARLMEVEWQGYSATKNNGNQLAKNDWILSLDADEVVNDELVASIIALFATTMNVQHAFSIQRKMVYEGKVLQHGSVGKEFRIRLFNRTTARWNQHEVHEDVEVDSSVVVTSLNGYALHYSFTSIEDHQQRLHKYAMLSAHQMHVNGKSSTWMKRVVSPWFHFLKNFIFRLGFLDGKLGFEFALHEKKYTAEKYHLLYQLNRTKNN